MIIISPEQFKQVFLSVVVPHEAELVRLWLGGNTKEYTHFMLRTLLPSIANQLNLQVYTRDYYLMDSVFYEEMHTEIFPPNQNYIKYIAIAFEHEHAGNTSKAEIHRLQCYNTPLKVLVTYPDNNNILSIYSNIMREADVFSDFSTLRKQLVIFGSRDGNKVNWGFYVYKDGGFFRI
jgi:hypothetical protein